MSLMHWLGTQCRGRRRLDDPWLRLGAVLVPCLACAVQWTFWSVLQPFVWFLFYPAVFLSARIAGLWGGLASTAVSVVLVWYFFMPPMLSWAMEAPNQIASVFVFLVVGYLIGEVHERLRRSQRHSDNLFDAAFDQAAVGIALVAPDGRWLRVNPRAAQIVGYSVEELLRMRFQEVTHPDDLAVDEAQIRDLLADRITQYALEKRYRRKDGRSVWVNLSVALLRTAEGEPDYFVSVIEDIDEKKRAQDEAMASKRQLEAALESMTDAVFISDLEGRITVFNEAFALLHKFPDKAACAQRFEDYPEILEVYSSSGRLLPLSEWAAPRALRGETASNVEFRLQRKDTGETWLGSYSFAPIHGVDGKIAGAVVVGRDVTEKKAAELAVRENERRLRLALDAAKAGMWEWNLRTGENIWSDEVFRLYGLAPGEQAPSFDTWVNSIHPDDRERAVNAAQLAGQTGRELNIEWRVRDAGESERWLMSRGQPIFGAHGEPERFLGIVMDVSEKKRADAELEQHRNHLEHLVQTRTAELAEANRTLAEHVEEIAALYNRVPCGYHSLAPDGRVLAINDTELDWLGYAREDVVGRPITDFMAPESQAFFAATFPRFLREGLLRDAELEFVCRDGSRLSALVSANLVYNADGTVQYSRSTMIDNRERKAREQMLAAMQRELARRADEAERATRSKSAFLANMSHEIRTPMNAILGLAHLILRAGLPQEQAVRVEKIESAGKHLLSIINDILDFSKIEAGRVQLESADFQLSALLENIQALINEEARSKGLQVTIDAEALPEPLRGDPTRLRQALLNYVSNALKFTEHGGIVLRARVLERQADTLLMRFEVEDSGIGITSEVLPGLFRSFEQGDASTTRKYGGTGLGLAITRRLALLMGGETGVSSEPGRGSVFWLTARLGYGQHGAEAAPCDPASDTEGRLRAGHARILLAEDNEINREVALELLNSVGLETDTAINGREVLEMVGRKAYDLVLMDIQMPEMDGLEATQALRRLPDWSSRPILAMTANAFNEDRQRCLDAGMNDFISKPVDPEMFFAVLDKWLPPIPQGSAAPRREAPGALAAEPEPPAPGVPIGLPEMPGVDPRLGMVHVRGHWPRYLRMLRQFERSYGDVYVDLLRQAREQGDWDSGLRLAHTLKGTARLIGASELGRRAEALEGELRAGGSARCATLEAALEDELQRIMAGLAAALAWVGPETPRSGHPEGGGPPARPLDVREARLLAEYRALLVGNDTVAARRLADVVEVLSAAGVTAGPIAAFSDAVTGFDFQKAVEILEGMTVGLGQAKE